jgi:PAS domain S-box-containing protein
MQILFVGVSCFGTAAFAVQRQRLCRELSQSNRRLASEATRFRAFLQNARDGIHILDIKGNIVDASDSFCRMLGYTRDETIGMNVVQWDANHTPAELEAFVKELFGRPETSTFETRHRRKDGSVFDVEVSGCPLEMDGQMVLFHSARDIADRKLAEQQMRVLEERYRNIFDTLLSG